jgi:hypothetical protein
VGWNYSPPLEGKTMTDYERTVKVLEGPWSTKAFPNGEYLCEEVVTREYRGNDYFDTSTNKRVLKLND